MKQRDGAVVILAVLIAVLLVGEITTYYLNPYSYSSNVYTDGDEVRYEVGASGSAEYRILQFDSSMEPVTTFYVFYEEDFPALGVSDAKRAVRELVHDLSIHGVDAILVDSDRLYSIVSNSDGRGQGIIIITGVLPSSVYDGSEGSPIRAWISTGGTLYWMGMTLGLHYADGDKQIKTAAGGDSFFFGEGSINTSSRRESATTRVDEAGDFLSIRGSNSQYGLSKDVPDSVQIGYVSDSGYGSAAVAKFGSGSIAIVGAPYEDTTRTDMVQIVASGVTYDYRLLTEDVVSVKGGSVTGDLDSSSGSVVYMYCGGYYSPYGSRFVI